MPIPFKCLSHSLAYAVCKTRLGWSIFFFFEKRKRDLLAFNWKRVLCFAIFPLFSRTWKPEWPPVTSSVLLMACFGQMQQTWRPLRLRLHEVTARCVKNRGKRREFEAGTRPISCLSHQSCRYCVPSLSFSILAVAFWSSWLEIFFLQSPGRVSWLFVCASLSAPVENRLVQLCIWLLPICPKLLLLKTKDMVHW